MMAPSLARVRFIKTKVIFRYHTKGVLNQVSSKSCHETKSYSCSNSSTIVGKNEKVKKFSGLLNGAIRGLQIGAKRLKIGAGITNRGKEISNRDRDYKSGQERFQIEAGITNRGRDYKSVQNTSIRYWSDQRVRNHITNLKFVSIVTAFLISK